MAYNITTTDGTQLTTIQPGQRDTSSTSLVLLGRGVSTYGQDMANNLVRLIESFASNSPPANPLEGQLWYDQNNDRLNVMLDQAGNYRSIVTTGSSGIVVSGTTDPSTLSSGDEGDLKWLDELNQLYAYDANDGNWVLVGPPTATGTQTGTAIVPVSGVGNVVLEIVNGQIVAGWSSQSIQTSSLPSSVNISVGGDTLQGINLQNVFQQGMSHGTTLAANQPNVKFDGKVTEAIDGFVTRSFSPETNTAFDIGGTNARYNTVYAETFDGQATAGAPIFESRNLAPVADNAYEIGTSSNKYSTVYAYTFNGVATQAQYADVAERFEADNEYKAGTVVKLGGSKEVTQTSNDADIDVIGVVSDSPGVALNSEAGPDSTHPYIAYVGRVYVKVEGTVKKGDRLVSSNSPGTARALEKYELKQWDKHLAVLGRALEDKSPGTGLVLAVIGA